METKILSADDRYQIALGMANDAVYAGTYFSLKNLLERIMSAGGRNRVSFGCSVYRYLGSLIGMGILEEIERHEISGESTDIIYCGTENIKNQDSWKKPINVYENPGNEEFPWWHLRSLF